MTTVEEFDFTGSVGADHAAEVMKQGNFEREIEFLSLDGSPAGKAQGKDNMSLRFVTDSVRRNPDEPMTKYNLGWITVQGHYAPVKPKPPYAREGQAWPTKMGAGCRKDPIFAKKYGGQCYICDQLNSKPSKRVWALAVERIEVRDDATGNVVGWADKKREVLDLDEKGDVKIIGKRDDGKDEYAKKIVPAWILISQGWRNFFQPLSGQVAYFQRTGSSGLLDADWNVTRTGTENTDTAYTPIRVATQTIPDDFCDQLKLPHGSAYDLSLRNSEGVSLMEMLYPDMPDLRKVLTDRVSDDYFGRFFVPGWLPEGFDPTKVNSSEGRPQVSHGMVMGANPSAPAANPTEEPASDALEALKGRVMGTTSS